MPKTDASQSERLATLAKRLACPSGLRGRLTWLLRGRSRRAELLSSGLFDPHGYELANPDVARAKLDAATHFLREGHAEGRPAPWGIGADGEALLRASIDAEDYEKVQDDLPAGMDPVSHYAGYGAAEGRDPAPGFSTSGYLERAGETNGANPLLHWLRKGRKAGLSPLPGGAHALALTCGRDPLEVAKAIDAQRQALRESIASGPLAEQVAGAAEIAPEVLTARRATTRPVIPPFMPDQAAARTAATIRLMDALERRRADVVVVCGAGGPDETAAEAIGAASDPVLMITEGGPHTAPGGQRAIDAGKILKKLPEEEAVRVLVDVLRALRPDLLLNAGSDLMGAVSRKYGSALAASMRVHSGGAMIHDPTPTVAAHTERRHPLFSDPDLSVIVLAHDEGGVLAQALRSANMAAAAAEQDGLVVERLLALDRPDPATEATASGWDGWRVERLDEGDVGRARGVALSRSTGRAVAWLDGDDLLGESFLSSAMERLAEEPAGIVHPEINWVFGRHAEIFVHLPQDDPLFVPEHVYAANYYDALCLAPRAAFETHPQSTRDSTRGLSFQDWQFAVESMAAGWRHVVAPGTAIFKRRRPRSRLTVNAVSGALVRQPETMAIERVHLLGAKDDPIFDTAAGVP